MANSAFSWLHLSDLHFGLKGQESLWPGIREAFFADLETVIQRTGPVQAVLFTGDLAQFGGRDEYERLNDDVLAPLWKRLTELGSGDAVLLAVPGNHDLVRPATGRKPGPAERFMLKAELFADVADEFWDDAGSEYRRVVDEAFANYLEWRRDCPFTQTVDLTDGLLPGDFAASLDLPDGRRAGVLGLNSAFLQLAGGDYEGKLCLHPRQFHEACGGDGPAWVGEHDVCLLMTHHPREWLDKGCQGDVYPEINKAGRFAVHLFGHMHEAAIRGNSSVGGPMLRRWQGNSLFSREPWGEPPRIERHHGFAAGRIEFLQTAAKLRYWPRQAVAGGDNGWHFDPDNRECVLNKDGGTRAEKVEQRGRPTSAVKPSAAARRNQRQDVVLSAYRRAALALVDIVDLANLPEDDRHIAMKQFVLRQLYIPLRMTLDAPTPDGLDDDTLEAWEQRRELSRLAAASRAKGDEAEANKTTAQSLGELLGSADEFATGVPRLAILGDPGGGKTTLLRWLATAWLLRSERPDDAAELPDIGSLPVDERLPILVRCRQLDREQMGACALEDILRQTLHQMELKLSETDVTALVEALSRLLEAGRAALLIDGLDEITEPSLRARFCEQIETIAARYEQAPIVATSRIVGYREMPRRLGRGFRHTTLAELTREDKDEFVRRWCDAVERDPARRRDEAAKLIRGIHDESGRVERLTGNPMLLTTMALVQRKVGDLPQRRHRLYEQAVSVLLNWRSDVDEPLSEDEAYPQLEYLAWAMCDRGQQRLRRDEVIELFEGVRRDYPNIRAVARLTPEEFLRVLEARTSLLVEVGTMRHNGLTTPVYEFRHLTFQEYLAAVALIRGHYPGHDPELSLAERIGPLAGRIEEVEYAGAGRELQVTENWREALRLCVAACNDADVDPALLAILDGEGGEVPRRSRPRAVLAALCLADEPNASPAVADEVLRHFAEVVRPSEALGYAGSGLIRAAAAVADSAWAGQLMLALSAEYLSRGPGSRAYPGTVVSVVASKSVAAAPVADDDPDKSEAVRRAWMQSQVARLGDPDERVAVAAALAVMGAAARRIAAPVPALADALIALTERGGAAAEAACWALWWLTGGHAVGGRKCIWEPTNPQIGQLARLLPSVDVSGNADSGAARYVALLACNCPSPAFEPGLRLMLARQAEWNGGFALGALARIRNDDTDATLVSADLDDFPGWLNPRSTITKARVQQAARKLDLSPAEIRRRYEALARDYNLRLEWTPDPT